MKSNKQVADKIARDLSKARSAVEKNRKSYYEAQAKEGTLTDALAMHTNKVVLGGSTLRHRGKLFRAEGYKRYPGGIRVLASRHYPRTGNFGKAVYELGRVSQADWVSE